MPWKISIRLAHLAILNLDSRPGRVIEFMKMCSGHGKVMEFRTFILFGWWLINKQIFDTLYRTSKSLPKRICCFHLVSCWSVVVFGGDTWMGSHYLLLFINTHFRGQRIVLKVMEMSWNFVSTFLCEPCGNKSRKLNTRISIKGPRSIGIIDVRCSPKGRKA